MRLQADRPSTAAWRPARSRFSVARRKSPPLIVRKQSFRKEEKISGAVVRRRALAQAWRALSDETDNYEYAIVLHRLSRRDKGRKRGPRVKHLLT